MISTETTYWDAVGDEWRRLRPHAVWRDFTDRQQLDLFDRWLGPAADHPRADGDRPRLLKTDLFDEVAGRGLVGGLTARGWEVTGIDLAPRTAGEAAARNAGLDAVVADVRSLPFPDGWFDAVFSGSTLDHFDDAADIGVALRELARVLRPGGHLVLTLDNPGNPLVRLRNGPLLGLLRRMQVVPYQVGATLPLPQLAAAADQAGFDVVGRTFVQHCPRVVAVRLAGWVERRGEPLRRRFQRALAACERLESLPTRWLTGHYIALHAVMPPSSRREQVTPGSENIP
jgi:SAM-dependent methyltransferase